MGKGISEKSRIAELCRRKRYTEKELQTEDEMMGRISELEKELRKKEKELSDEKEKVEILKNPCTS